MIALSVFLCIDLLVYLVIFRRLSGLHPRQQEELEYRNPYTNLEDLYRTGLINVSDYPPIVSMPRISAQVSPIEQTRVFPQDEHRWLSQYGTVSPPDRHVLVTSSVGALTNFRSTPCSSISLCGRLIRLSNSERWTSGWNAVFSNCAFRHRMRTHRWFSVTDPYNYASSTRVTC